MTKLVVFKLDGDFTQEFKVNIEIFLEDSSFYGRVSGKLPANPQLLECLNYWQLEYVALGQNTRIKGKKVIATGSSVKSQLRIAGQKLEQEFQQWLKAEGFYNLNIWLREHLDIKESVRVLLCADNQKIHQLPWSSWNFFKHYQNAGITFSELDSTVVVPAYPFPQKSQVRILAIFGNSQDINVAKDLAILENLDGADIKKLFKPQQEELYNCLWSKTWDIVFFAGHSKTVQKEGIIYLNDKDMLTINQLRYGFQRAINNGLQLAIFNSCDGLGLAYTLSQLGLPQAIVMREPVDDTVAHKFLNYFLAEYYNEQPLHLATRRARERLQAIETRYPYSSWLPVLYQNQSATPLLWSELASKKPTSVVDTTHPSVDYRGILAIAIALIVTWLFQTLGWMQTGELQHFDRALSLRPSEGHDKRILVVTVDDSDIQYQSQQGMTMRGSLSDVALDRLLSKLQLYQPVAIASDIVHDFAYQPQLAQTIAQNDFVAICRIANQESNLDSIAPPPEIKTEQLGFTNMAIDDDGVIRRHLLGMSPDKKVCQSDMSLSLRMALKYLDYQAAKVNNQDIYPRQFDQKGFLVIGNTTVPKIEATSGAYVLPKTEERGYQTLLNYRPLSPQTISLQEIIEENNPRVLETLIKEKLIFIGVKSNNNDSHHIPYSRGKQAAKIPGVLIHAQGTSQIISAVLDNRKLINWFPHYLEFVWVIVWSVVGINLQHFYQRFFAKKFSITLYFLVTTIVLLAIIYISYYGLLCSGYWLSLIASVIAFFVGTLSSIFLNKKVFFVNQPEQKV